MEYRDIDESCSATPPPCSSYPPPPLLPHHQGVVFLHDHRQRFQPQQVQQQEQEEQEHHHHHHQKNHDRYQVVDFRDAAASAAAGGARVDGGLVFPPQVAPTVPPWTLPSSLVPKPPPPPHLYSEFRTARASAAAAATMRFGHDGDLVPQDSLMDLTGLFRGGGGGMSSTTPSPLTSSLQSEFLKMSGQEIGDAKALAASKSHSEAERRRRERINNHLARLRSLLPSTTKTDKASLLAEAIQHVKELKHRACRILEEMQSPVPTESDELTVDAMVDDAADDDDSDGDEGKFVVKASMCCDDRSDLLAQLIEALKELRLRAVKAEMSTLGGRVKNVLLVTGEHERHPQQQTQYSVSSIQEALKAVMEGSTSPSGDHPSSTTAAGAAVVKRQRKPNPSRIRLIN